jgi:hypothetical protein
VLAVSAQVGSRELRVITIPAAGSTGHGTFFGGGVATKGTTTGGTPGAIDFGVLAAASLPGATQTAKSGGDGSFAADSSSRTLSTASAGGSTAGASLGLSMSSLSSALFSGAILSGGSLGGTLRGTTTASSPTPVPAPTGIALASTTRPHDAISFRMPATTPAGTYRVQVFRTAATRIGGGQGEVLLATRDVTVTTSSGAFTIGSLAGILAGDRITLTATRIEAGVPKGTSAFSSAVTAG